MHTIHRPTESELMELAWTALRKRASAYEPVPLPVAPTPSRPADPQRRERSLRSCHLPRDPERAKVKPRATGGYVPETSARIEDDPNLCDGARRCARKLMEETYRRNREGRNVEITVSYLAKGLRRCRRTVQRYLRQLEDHGYIEVDVIAGLRSRLCVGLAIRLLAPLFPRHHREKWPEARRKPGATRESQNDRFSRLSGGRTGLVSRKCWAIRCMDGVFRALMECERARSISLTSPQRIPVLCGGYVGLAC